MSRQEDLGVNMPKGYPSMVLYIDMLGPAPESAENLCQFFVMQDRHTKYAMDPLIPKMQSLMVAEQLLISWVPNFSFPKSIHSELWNAFEG